MDFKKEGKDYRKNFNEGKAYEMLKKMRKATRGKVILDGSVKAVVIALGTLLSALKNPRTPDVVKAEIAAAIGYIIFPLDLIPDSIPGLGFTDDLAATSLLVSSVKTYSTFSIQKLDREIDREC